MNLQNLISKNSYSNIKGTCLSDTVIQVNFNELSNGDLCLLCNDLRRKYENIHFYKFDSSFAFITDHLLSLNGMTNFIENVANEIVLGSTNILTDSTKNCQMTLLTTNGDSLYSKVIVGQSDERPSYLIQNSDNNIVLVGSINCCNYDTTIGPSKSFLLLGGQITTFGKEIKNNNYFELFPNPAENLVIIQSNSVESKDLVIEILNSLGEKVKTKSIHSRGELNISDLCPGLYFYHVLVKNELVSIGKFIKNGG